MPVLRGFFEEKIEEVNELSEKSLKLLSRLQADAFKYFLEEVNLKNGMIVDSTKKGWPASIAAIGLALSCYPVGVAHDLLTREEAAERTLTTLRFFAQSEQSTSPDATGYKGFYYHFLDMKTGRRAWESELSTVDSAFLIAGMLAAAAYFNDDTAKEDEIRKLADKLYRRVDWQWATNKAESLTQGYKPKHGFLRYRYKGYDESLLLYVLGLGSPTSPLPPESYHARNTKYLWKKIYGYEYLYAAPLFTHQLSHVWLDMRGIQDQFMREHDLDYFENSRRATYVHREYGRRNPKQWEGYSEVCWGLTACEGPGPKVLRIKGKKRKFFDYVARGAPYGPDDGTVAPWAVVASLPFAPEIVLPTLEHFKATEVGKHRYGLEATFNTTFPGEDCRKCGWLSPWHYGINQGPIVLMIENYRTGFLWELIRQCPYVITGLRRAGFKGGWLDS
jgi:hypothetical protein